MDTIKAAGDPLAKIKVDERTKADLEAAQQAEVDARKRADEAATQAPTKARAAKDK